MSGIEKDLKDKSQSIGDWWNCVPSLDKKGVSGTLLVRLSDAVEGVKDVREEAQAKRLPINWRSNKEVIALVQSAIKNTREDEINKLQQVDKELAKEIFSCMDSQDPNHNTNSWEKELKKVEVRVRAEIQSIWDSSITNDLFSYKMSNWLKRKTEAQKK